MKNFLNTITDRIRGDERHEFAAFRAAEFPLVQRPAPAGLPAEGGFALIAEIKRGSPSLGPLHSRFGPEELALAYEAGGASAVSVITERNFFSGDKDLLRRVKKAVRLPVLRKDFIVHEYQVYESYNLGADLLLLIAACLGESALRRLHRAAVALGLQPLVEVHDEADLRKALAAGARLVGINNRDLRTFAVDWRISLCLRPLVPPEIRVISESGIRTADQVRALREAEFAGALVGEHLIRQADPRAALEELLHE